MPDLAKLLNVDAVPEPAFTPMIRIGTPMGMPCPGSARTCDVHGVGSRTAAWDSVSPVVDDPGCDAVTCAADVGPVMATERPSRGSSRRTAEGPWSCRSAIPRTSRFGPRLDRLPQSMIWLSRSSRTCWHRAERCCRPVGPPWLLVTSEIGVPEQAGPVEATGEGVTGQPAVGDVTDPSRGERGADRRTRGVVVTDERTVRVVAGRGAVRAAGSIAWKSTAGTLSLAYPKP